LLTGVILLVIEAVGSPSKGFVLCIELGEVWTSSRDEIADAPPLSKLLIASDEDLAASFLLGGGGMKPRLGGGLGWGARNST
jgi:hypothetical protein